MFDANPRIPHADVEAAFTDRWSPRSFLPDPVSDAQFLSLLEAARWSPSSMNEQPWFFLWARSEKDRKLFASLLIPFNQAWASKAPLLMFVLARRTFASSGDANPWAAFDAGAGWMSIALQARKLGLHAHAMAGFDAERAYERLNVSGKDYEILAAIAVGQRGPVNALGKELAEREAPNDRRPLSEIHREGPFQAERARL